MSTNNVLIGKRIRAARERLADELDAAHERAVRAARNEAPADLQKLAENSP